MPGVRKITATGVGDADTRIQTHVPSEIGRQLRALAAQEGSSVSAMVRAWIILKLKEVDPGGRIAHDRRPRVRT